MLSGLVSLCRERLSNEANDVTVSSLVLNCPELVWRENIPNK